MKVEERFLKYVSYWTTSCEDVDVIPSTERQFDLGKELAKELDEKGYVQLYVVQVCKEIQNTPTGPLDTGYMLGMEISNPDEWANVQKSITKIVEDKKNNTQSSEIQYLPINMLVNLKIISK